jgi:hypothetical protein
MAVENVEEIREAIPNIGNIAIEQEPITDHLSEVEQYWENWRIREKAKKEQEISAGLPRKKYDPESVIWNFFNSKDRQHYRKGAKVFFEYDTLYSYGHHFRLAVKTRAGGFIVNADRYSRTTDKHTSITIYNAPERTPQIPFTALERAHINVKDIVVIDKTADTWEKRQVEDGNGGIKTIEVHHLGACLFMHRGAFYLSSLDNASRGRQYFLVQLKHGADSVTEALKQISGLTKEDFEAYERGEIKRQGEYFFIPVGSTAELKELMKQNGIKRVLKPRYEILFGGEWIQYGDIEKGIDLGHRIYHQNTPSRSPHIARDYLNGGIPEETSNGEVLPAIFVRGTVRHPEHDMLRLGETWHKVHLNDVVDSWSATGRVD